MRSWFERSAGLAWSDMALFDTCTSVGQPQCKCFAACLAQAHQLRRLCSARTMDWLCSISPSSDRVLSGRPRQGTRLPRASPAGKQLSRPPHHRAPATAMRPPGSSNALASPNRACSGALQARNLLRRGGQTRQRGWPDPREACRRVRARQRNWPVLSTGRWWTHASRPRQPALSRFRLAGAASPLIARERGAANTFLYQGVGRI